ncbi:MAG: trimethylamine methyltransferase family protein [Planctomycetota bacterium]|jgi:trimethylamine--corrinoid protein Co-methyltransferase
MKLAMLKVLSEQEVKNIHEASLDILANCGMKILSRRMFDFLKEKRFEVDEQNQIVRFSRRCIEDALSTIPSQFEVFDRQGKFAFVLGDRKPKFAAGHNAVFWVDSKTGERRNSTVADVELFARICQQLECIDMIGIPVMPQDVPDPKATLLYGVKACIENSTKPIYFSTNNLKVNKACIEMLRAAFKGNFQEQIYGINQLSPTRRPLKETSRNKFMVLISYHPQARFSGKKAPLKL